MNRRDFLRRAALLAAGTVAADQLELVERLGWTRRLFPGWTRGPIPVPTTVTVRWPDPTWGYALLVDQYGVTYERRPIVDGMASATVLGGAPPGLRFLTA